MINLARQNTIVLIQPRDGQTKLLITTQADGVVKRILKHAEDKSAFPETSTGR